MNEYLTRVAVSWAAATFGAEDTFSSPRRTLRLIEEAVELGQAMKLDRALIHKLVDTVYERPRGVPEQEMGGVALTFAVLCGINGGDPSHYLTQELCRVLAKPPEDLQKRRLKIK